MPRTPISTTFTGRTPPSTTWADGRTPPATTFNNDRYEPYLQTSDWALVTDDLEVILEWQWVSDINILITNWA